MRSCLSVVSFASTMANIMPSESTESNICQIKTNPQIK